MTTALLQEKVLGLLLREQELYALRQRGERDKNFTRAILRLAKTFDAHEQSITSYTQILQTILMETTFQAALFFEVNYKAQTVTLLTHLGVRGNNQPFSVPLHPELLAFLRQNNGKGGICNKINESPALEKLTQLHRFVWYPIDLKGDNLLLVAGHDGSTAPCSATLDSNDLASFSMLGQLLEHLLHNGRLAKEVE